MKTLLITSFDIKGIVHFEFILQGQTVNQAYYVESYVNVCVEKGLKFAPSIRLSIMTMLQLIRRSLSSSSLAQKSVTEKEHPPHSTDRVPNDL
jgi:hypothetical protein